MGGTNKDEAYRSLREAAAHCRNCDLWKRATQTVFGSGPLSARIMMVGEQPGDEEDIEGEPFVGPAGRVLDRALQDAGIDREHVYVTNAVKHFKWVEGRGTRRLHKKPNVAEMNACRPWLESELDLIQSDIVVCLGATAARALLGRGISVLRDRSKVFRPAFAPVATVTVHPSSVLRQHTDEDRRQARLELTADLRRVLELLDGNAAG